MKQQHHPKDVRTYNIGANRDSDKEIASAEEGIYVDSENMRPSSIKGDSAGALSKINGEELKYGNQNNKCPATSGPALAGDWECIGMIEVNEKIVEFWTDVNLVEDPLIRIDGKIVLRSPDFPIIATKPLQIHKNESCTGGEIYVTDNFNPPMIFNIGDLLENSGIGGTCTEKYFTEFNLKEHILILSQPVDHPVFVELVDEGAGGGKQVGQYQYAIRYATTAGDRTQWSVSTPLIGVPSTRSTASSQYPDIKSTGADPDVSNPGGCTNFGIKIRFRVVNLQNFDFIEIRRIRYISGGAIGETGVAEVLSIPASVANLAPGEISVREFTDNCSTTVSSTLTDDEDADTMSAVKTAKAVRYFNNRLYLMNVKFESRDLSGQLTFKEVGSKKMYPVIQKLGIRGHNDPYNYVHYKNYMGGEKYGFGVVTFDDRGDRTFVEKVPAFDNYQYPNRRDALDSDSEDLSYDGSVRAATVASGAVGKTHEIFDFGSGASNTGVAKADLCTFKNILDEGSKSKSKVNSAGCPDAGHGSTVTGSEVGYRPYTPTNKDDSTVTGHDYRVNVNVFDGFGLRDYTPKGFAQNYFSHGMAFAGLTGLPTFAQAFSVVRTAAAGAVVAQGLGFYSLNSAEGPFGANTTKNVNKIWFHSPDVEHGIFNISDVISNPDRYEIQLVSPLGFFSETYDGDDVTTRFKGIDMVSYCRLLRDKPGSSSEINPFESSTYGFDGSDGFRYVGYGKWRDPGTVTGGSFPSGSHDGNKIFNINSISTKTEGRGTYYEIELDVSVYANGTTSGGRNFLETGLQQWHEPVYIVNIIQKGRDVPTQDIQDYLETGHYQKVDAIIAQSTGEDEQSYRLVDERWEDCITDITDSGGTPLATTFSTLERYVFIDDETGVQKRWVNITYKTSGQITTILDDIKNNGFHTNSEGKKVYGVYVHDNESNQNRFFSILFGRNNVNTKTGVSLTTLNTYSDSSFSPSEDDFIRVKYDDRIPIRFFGGDTTIGEAVFSPVDKLYNKDGDPTDSANDFRINVGMPYLGWNINPRVYIINRTTGVNKIQDNNLVMFDSNLLSPALQPSQFRQLLAMYTVESRIHMPLAYATSTTDGYFPATHYIMRPHRWDDSPLTAANNNIFDTDYTDDYGTGELSNWGYGGFRFLARTNIDYSKEPRFRIHFSKPQVGFKEQNEFCTRVIWSVTRAINVQDSPGVRTFPSLNFFDISDDTGEIKFAWDSISGKGSNLYAFTNDGVVLLLTDKRILHEVSGNELSTIGAEGSEGVLKQIFISKDVGMHDEMWRTFADFNNVGFFANKNSVYEFSDNNLQDIGRIKYHSKIYQGLLKEPKSGFSDKMTAVYDILNNEYWLHIKKTPIDIIPSAISGIFGSAITYEINPGDVVDNGKYRLVLTVVSASPPNTQIVHIKAVVPKLTVKMRLQSTFYGGETATLKNPDFTDIVTGLNDGDVVILTYNGSTYDYVMGTEDDVLDSELYVYNNNTKHWVGTFKYLFDRMVSFNNKVYGARDLETYELGKGFYINGALIEAAVTGLSAKEQPRDKEFVRIRINSDNKPQKVQFFNNMAQHDANQKQAELDTVATPGHLKNYYGFEQYIPRKLASVDSNTPRMQGRLLIFKIIHNLQEDFKVIDTEVQYKALK